MKNAMKTVVLTSLFTLMITMAQADQFIRPPETYAPVWYTSFPYQRNIDMGFSVNPVSSPGYGIPGAVYEGTLDSSLLSSDYVTLTGAATWYASVSGFTQTGLIGIDNRAGNSTLTGTAVFHIDNIPVANWWKDVWAESLDLDNQAYAGEFLNWQVFDPNNNPAMYLGGPANSLLGNNEWLSDAEWQITPNPSYETLVETFSVPAGDYALIDNLHIATECVPEPATFSLLALGGLALLWRRRS
jgi:hypothetical protein